ncbi:MAG: TetR/AcrR family transcriptional repressor of nem operon [Verrucomicrobiales bacterium]|jgi:TetR/AcrR family transcriptional repressor of nem operon
MNETAEQILDAAQTMIRDGGYHAFSFRQIADHLDIKGASVHYHFPTKEDLGTAVAIRYTERFLEALGEPTSQSDPIKHYISLFRNALESDHRACLCGILAAESSRLPDTLRETLQSFGSRNVEWLIGALKSKHAKWPKKRLHEMATVVFSALEGAMTFAPSTKSQSTSKRPAIV